MLCLACGAALFATGTATASEPDSKWDRAMVEGYAEEMGVTDDEAWRHLTVQRQGGDAVGQAERRLGDGYAGVWFDNERGRFEIGVAPSTDRAAARAWIDSRKLGSSADLVPVESTWDELEAAKAELEKQLFRTAGENDRLQVALDPSANAIEVRGTAADGRRGPAPAAPGRPPSTRRSTSSPA